MQVEDIFKDKVIYYDGGAHQSLEHPANTRRFPRFADKFNIKYTNYYEQGDDKYDIIVVAQAADLSFWRRQVKSGKIIIFDANDPYLITDGNTLKDRFRGLFKYLSGRNKFLDWNFKKSYELMCLNSNLVITGSREQYDYLKEKGIEVSFIIDYGISIPIQSKCSHCLVEKNEINIFWEGLGTSYLPFKDIEKLFLPIRGLFNFKFHFVTDLNISRIGGKYLNIEIVNLAKRQSPTFYDSFKFYKWNESIMNKIAISCDFAIIPLPLDRSINYYKPENKLIHMWRMALPTIVSAIPSYERVMKEIGQMAYSTNDEEWRYKILELSKDQIQRSNYGIGGLDFANKNYSEEIIDQMWHNALIEIIQ